MKNLFLLITTLSLMIMLMSGCATTRHPAAAFREQVGVAVPSVKDGNLEIHPIFVEDDNGDSLATNMSLLEYHVPVAGASFYCVINGIIYDAKRLEEIEYILLRGEGFFQIIEPDQTDIPDDTNLPSFKAYYDKQNRIIWTKVPNNLISGNFVFIYSKNDGEDGVDAVWTHVWNSPTAYNKGEVWKWYSDYEYPNYIPRGTP